MKNYLILILMAAFLTEAKADEDWDGGTIIPPPKKYDGITQTMTLSQPNNLAPPIGQYKYMGWGGAGTLNPRGVVDEWEEYRSN